MNKDDYIKAVDNITAPDSLKEKIINQNNIEKKTGIKKYYKVIAAVAACLVVIVGFSAVSGITMGSSKAEYDAAPVENGFYAADSEISEEYNEAQSMESADSSDFKLKSKTETNRKIIKNAELNIQTKDYDKFITALNEKINALGGYTDSLEENNYSSKNATIVARVPSEKLDEFLSGVEKIGTVQSKNISKSDVTDSYNDIESRITALETEEKALLKILGDCDTVSETIEVQSRLSEVRAQIESFKSQKKSYDSQISYSKVTIYVSEEERILKNDGSFSSRLKEKFDSSIYNISSFFENLALNFLGGILYILIAAAIAVVVIIIVKKRKKSDK